MWNRSETKISTIKWKNDDGDGVTDFTAICPPIVAPNNAAAWGGSNGVVDGGLLPQYSGVLAAPPPICPAITSSPTPWSLAPSLPTDITDNNGFTQLENAIADVAAPPSQSELQCFANQNAENEKEDACCCGSGTGKASGGAGKAAAAGAGGITGLGSALAGVLGGKKATTGGATCAAALAAQQKAAQQQSNMMMYLGLGAVVLIIVVVVIKGSGGGGSSQPTVIIEKGK